MLLCTTKELYVSRLSVTVGPEVPGFEDTRWITSEDINVEHLLDVFTSTDPNSNVWNGCNGFIAHLFWHKPRRTVLGPKIEQLPDDHPWKPRGLFELSWLLESVGNNIEQKRLLTRALGLWRERGDIRWVACALQSLSCANRLLGLHAEGIYQATEALEVFEKVGDTVDKVGCLIDLARLLLEDEQLDAAEEVTVRSINLLEEGPEFLLCQSHRILGDISRSKGEREKAVYHYNVAIEAASRFNWRDQLFWIYYSLAILFDDEDESEDANAYILEAKKHALNDKYCLGRAMATQARIWYQQGRVGDGASEVSGAIEIFERLGAVRDLEECQALLQDIEGTAEGSSISGESDSSGEHYLETNLVSI